MHFPPILLEITHQFLGVEVIRLNITARHVRREAEHFRRRFAVQVTGGDVEVPWHGEIVRARGEDVAPFAKGRHVNVIRRGVEVCRFQRCHHRPVSVGREVRRGGLHDQVAAGREVARNKAVHRHGVEFAEREVGRVGQVDDDDIEGRNVFFQPLCGVGVDDAQFWVVECAMVERGQCGGAGEGAGHFRVQIAQGNTLNLRVFQYFACGEAVAAAEDEDARRVLCHLHRRQYQRFVVARLIARGELQVAVQVKAGVVLPAGDDQALVGGVALVNDGVAVVALFGEGGDAVGGKEGGGKRGEDEPGAQAERGVTRQLAAEDVRGEQGDGGVQDAKEQRRARHAKARREQQRK